MNDAILSAFILQSSQQNEWYYHRTISPCDYFNILQLTK